MAQVESSSLLKEDGEKEMRELKFTDLVDVSNNSKITQNVFEAIDKKLTEQEKDDFRLWLSCMTYYGQLNKK
jgi:hypothetical protein